MTQFQFRIWCDYEKVMLKDVSLHNALMYSTGTDAITLSGSGDARKLMQFTGLLDKNGTKIFEGDILKFRNGKATVESITDIWHGIGVRDKAASGNGALCPQEAVYKFERACEVIGNIYESAEVAQ